MIRCKLCNLYKLPKPNTHYLSDFLIKTALNDEGSSKRGRGIYWGIDTSKSVVDFKFQTDAPIMKLEKLLGRSTTDVENYDARYNIDFAVSDSFCKSCEDIFTKIENDFNNQLLSKFRVDNLTGVNKIILNPYESKLLRLFFLMQFWRTSVSTDSVKLPPNILELIRVKIFTSDYTDLEKIPLSVYYLQTVRGANDDDKSESYKTQNVISVVDKNDPHQIIINDFVIQLYDNTTFKFDDFFGLNNASDYIIYLNHNIVSFEVKVIDNTNRLEFLKKYFSITAKKFLANMSWQFFKRYVNEFQKLPNTNEINTYLNVLASNSNMMTFTSEVQEKFDREYFKDIE